LQISHEGVWSREKQKEAYRTINAWRICVAAIGIGIFYYYISKYFDDKYFI